jgi:hypothetical protein
VRRCIATVALGLSAIVWQAAPAAAQWGASAAGLGAAAATTITAPGTVTASCSSLLAASVKVTWAAGSTPWVTQYEVRWGTNPSAPTQSALVTGLSHSTPALGLGTWYFTVRSAAGAWRSPVSNQPSRLIVSVLGLGACV